MSNREKIIQSFKIGKIPNAEGDIPKNIVTVVSDVFVFNKKAYKIYKSNSEFFNKNFNDLSNKENRFTFSRNDYIWNNKITPEVYVKLSGIIFSDDHIKFVDPDDMADELVLEMSVVDMSNQLIKLLYANKISLDDCFQIGKQFGERSLQLPKLNHTNTVYEDFTKRLIDIEPWVNSVKAIPKNKTKDYINYLQNFIEQYKNELSSKDFMGTCIDLHVDNAVFVNNSFFPIDIYAPKEAWLHGYKFLNIYRIATDIYGFLGLEGFEKVLAGYEIATNNICPREYDKFLITYCELINWPYQYMLAEKEPWRLEIAKKYENVLSEIHG